ncbi:MAG: SHOCT domain-containing protein [Candidatus Thermoplasmatota archaeon]|jgi:putative membrane protein|nr:SHOCT domain-containing protein [Candidatus Thermoplasmatota archaeon]MCL5793997.1 SHOCT domain-containing protein [Candidatus Thermoplasmatota archaeon]
MENKIGNLMWILVGLVAVVAAMAIIVPYISGTFYQPGPYGMMGGYGYYPMFILMPVMGAITLVFVILFIYFLVEVFRGEEWKHSEAPGKTPEEIAKERFARGEITEEQYLRIMDTIK